MSKFEKLRTYLNDEAKEKNCLIFKRVSLKLLPLVKRVQPLVRVWTCDLSSHDDRCIPMYFAKAQSGCHQPGHGGFSSMHITRAVGTSAAGS